MRLADTIGRWLGRVEIVITGLDDRFREGEEALSRGDAMRARAAAHAVLAGVPGSPLGLALLADACEAGGLDAEAHMTLEELAALVPSQAEVWLRLGRARQRTGASADDVRDAFVRALAVAEAGSEERTAALLALADLDLAASDGARAGLWLERAPEVKSAPITLRRAEARLLQRDAKGALSLLRGVELDPTDGRAALALGRALATLDDSGAFVPLVRAWVLDTPGASEALSSTLAWVPSDEATRARVRTVVEARGESELARWRAAFARAEGKRDEARMALVDAVRGGDAGAARPLLDAALEDGDEKAAALALEVLGNAPDVEVDDARRLLPGAKTADAQLDELRRVRSARVLPLARKRVRALLSAWLPDDAAAWDLLLARLDAHARELHDLPSMAAIASLAGERARPVRVAIVGEFNAGKSTFINALVGADVAPTGVLPTTATLHHLRYGPDPIARIALDPDKPDDPKERIVPSSSLRDALKSIDPARVKRVEILQPIAFLTRVEILDTPGFNAPDARHTEAAASAFEEADAAIWLLDAGQPLKQSERTILEDAKARRLPVQILVNKADRLGAEALGKVMDMVHTSLDEVGLRSLAPPVAMSARLALAGKLGDEAALAASRWADVQKLLDEDIVARSGELKERALRRRCARIAAVLRATAATAARAEDEARAEAEARRHELSAAAARLDRDAEEIAGRIAQSLEAPSQALAHDLEVVVTGRDEARAATDAVLQRYRVDRAVVRLAPALASALARETSSAGVDAEAWGPVARAVVRAAAFTAPARQASLAGPVARAAVASATEQLGARAVEHLPPRTMGGLISELDELLALLSA